MWRKRSLIYPAVTFLLLAIGATLVLGYAVNYAILEDVLQERMGRQAQQVSRAVQVALERKVSQLEGFKNSWMENAHWSQEVKADNRLSGTESTATLDSMWGRLSALLPLWGVDFILLVDAKDTITHRMPADFQTDQPLPKELLAQVRRETKQNKGSWQVAKVAGAWRMMLFAPFEGDSPEQGRIVVFGQGLAKVVNQLHQETPERPFVLAALDGIAAGSPLSLARARYEQTFAVTAINDNTSRMDFDPSLSANLYYSPLPFLNQVFALVVPVSLDEVRQVLANSQQRLIGAFVIIVLLLTGLGVLMERIFLRPLRHLRNKAAIMVRACSGEEQALYLNPDEQGNELALLERAMEEASIKLYSHVAHLVDTKHLLEGMTLKDPVTMLGNRRMLDEFLTSTLRLCKRKERQVAVILINPDPLEQLPGFLAAGEGQQIHRELADRLRNQLRGEDLAFRVDHNDFVAFAPECGDEEQVLALVHRLNRALAKPYRLKDNREVTIGIQMGVSVFPGAGDNVVTLLDNARTALISVHKGSRYPFAVFNYPHITEEED